jgi:hypothetical protein
MYYDDRTVHKEQSVTTTRANQPAAASCSAECMRANTIHSSTTKTRKEKSNTSLFFSLESESEGQALIIEANNNYSRNRDILVCLQEIITEK